MKSTGRGLRGVTWASVQHPGAALNEKAQCGERVTRAVVTIASKLLNTMGIARVSNPLCHLYFFSCIAKGGILSIHPQIKKAICEYGTVKGFSFVRETSTLTQYSKAKALVEQAKGTWKGHYPNAAIIRYDGVILDVFLYDSLTI